MNIRVVIEEDFSSFLLLCNHCGKPISDGTRGVCRWFEDSGHIVLAHKGKCDKALVKQLGELPAIDPLMLTLCMAGNLGVETREGWIAIWDDNIPEDEEEDTDE